MIDALEAVGRSLTCSSAAYSSSYYGIGRSTKDADFVVELMAGIRSASLIAPARALRFDSIRRCLSKRSRLTTQIRAKVADNPFMFEFFLLSSDPHDQEQIPSPPRVAVAGPRGLASNRRGRHHHQAPLELAWASFQGPRRCPRRDRRSGRPDRLGLRLFLVRAARNQRLA